MRIRKQAREGSDRNSKAEQHCTVVIQLQNFSNFVKNCLFVLLAGRHSMGFLKRHNFNRSFKKSNSTWKIVPTNNSLNQWFHNYQGYIYPLQSLKAGVKVLAEALSSVDSVASQSEDKHAFSVNA